MNLRGDNSVITKFLTFSLALAILLCASVVSAQNATPLSKVAIDQAAPDVKSAGLYTYKYYADGSTTGVTVTGVTCTGTISPFTCTFSIPAFTPGNHSITVTASNEVGESPKSLPLTFTFVVVPATPVNLRLQ